MMVIKRINQKKKKESILHCESLWISHNDGVLGIVDLTIWNVFFSLVLGIPSFYFVSHYADIWPKKLEDSCGDLKNSALVVHSLVCALFATDFSGTNLLNRVMFVAKTSDFFPDSVLFSLCYFPENSSIYKTSLIMDLIDLLIPLKF